MLCNIDYGDYMTICSDNPWGDVPFSHNILYAGPLKEIKTHETCKYRTYRSHIAPLWGGII